MKKALHLAHLISHSIYADQAYLFGILAQLNSLSDKKELKAFENENQLKNNHFFAVPTGNGDLQFSEDDDNVPAGSVFIMQLRGPVIPETTWGYPGLDLLGDQLRWAANNDNIGSIVFALETGGGSGYKLEAFCDILTEVKAKKPVLTLADHYCCSAGIFISVGGDESYVSHATSMVGSIGVMVDHLDTISYLEKIGCKYHYVVAKTSPDKNKNYRDMRKGKYEGLEEHLTKYHARFKSHVLKGRGEVPEEAMTGKTFDAEEAIKFNLFDGIANLEQVVSRAYQLSQTKKAAVA